MEIENTKYDVVSIWLWLWINWIIQYKYKKNQKCKFICPNKVFFIFLKLKDISFSLILFKILQSAIIYSETDLNRVFLNIFIFCKKADSSSKISVVEILFEMNS